MNPKLSELNKEEISSISGGNYFPVCNVPSWLYNAAEFTLAAAYLVYKALSAFSLGQQPTIKPKGD